jgi:3-deoxy-D-arabino-heptulosonate 7-phosphate (DAHP) synthase class II
MRPVRVESWATETVHGEEVWDDMEVAVYLWNELKALPLEVRAKKEIQLKTNLAKVMEALADSMSAEKLTMTDLQKRQG